MVHLAGGDLIAGGEPRLQLMRIGNAEGWVCPQGLFERFPGNRAGADGTQRQKGHRETAAGGRGNVGTDDRARSDKRHTSRVFSTAPGKYRNHAGFNDQIVSLAPVRIGDEGAGWEYAPA